MKISVKLLMIAAAFGMAHAQHHAEEVNNRRDTEAVRGAHHLDLHDAETGAHRGANTFDQNGNDKSSVQTVAQLTAAMAASDSHQDSYSQLLDNAHSVEAETEHDHQRGADAELGVHHGVNSDVDVDGDQHIRREMVHRLHQNDWDGIEEEQHDGRMFEGDLLHDGHDYDGFHGAHHGAHHGHGHGEYPHMVHGHGAGGPHGQWHGGGHHGHGQWHGDDDGNHHHGQWHGDDLLGEDADLLEHGHHHNDGFLEHGHGAYEDEMLPWIAGGH